MSSSDHSMSRENDMKIVIENLRRDCCSMEGEMEKLRHKETEYEQLAESVARLLEEIKVSNDREKRAMDRCDKVLAENSEITIQKNDFILELLKKVDKLKDMNLENECLMRLYKEKYECSDMNIVKMDKEMKDLKYERLAAAKTIEELKWRIFESNKTIDQLRLKKLESDKLAEEYRTGLKKLESDKLKR